MKYWFLRQFLAAFFTVGALGIFALALIANETSARWFLGGLTIFLWAIAVTLWRNP